MYLTLEGIVHLNIIYDRLTMFNFMVMIL